MRSSVSCVAEFIELAEIDRLALDSSQHISDEDLAEIMTAAVRLYSTRAEMRDAFPPPLVQAKLTATDVISVVSEMMRVVDINSFDVSMWHGRPRPK